MAITAILGGIYISGQTLNCLSHQHPSEIVGSIYFRRLKCKIFYCHVCHVTRFCLCVVVCGSWIITLYWSKNWVNDRSKPTLPSIHPSVPTIMIQTPTNESCQQAAATEMWTVTRELTGDLNGLGECCVYSTAGLTSQQSGAGTALVTATLLCWPWLVLFRVTTAVSVLLGTSLQPQPSSNSRKTLQQQRQHHISQTENRTLAIKKRIWVLVTWYRVIGSTCEVSSVLWRGHWHNQQSVMEFKNVVFNAARDGKLRRLKVSPSFRPGK